MANRKSGIIWSETTFRRDGRVVEGAPLLREYGSKVHRGFKSHSLRQVFCWVLRFVTRLYVMEPCPKKMRLKKMTYVACISLGASVVGLVMLSLGDRLSYVDASSGQLVDNPLLMLGGTFVLFAGLLVFSGVVLIKAISRVVRRDVKIIIVILIAALIIIPVQYKDKLRRISAIYKIFYYKSLLIEKSKKLDRDFK